MSKRYHRSAKGDFYVALGKHSPTYGSCCLAGGAPHLIAPEFCSYEEDGTKRYCYVYKQPRSELEIYQMLKAMYQSEFRCLRYEGTDANIVSRMIELGIAAEVCDSPLTDENSAIVRRFCTFQSSGETLSTPKSIAEILRAELYAQIENYQERHKALYLISETKPLGDEVVCFDYSWTMTNPPFKGHPIIHQIKISKRLARERCWLEILSNVVDRQFQRVGVQR